MRVVRLLVAVMALVGCLLPARQFSFVLAGPAQIEDLPVIFEDRTGVVESVGPAQPGQFNLQEGVAAGADPSVLVISWLGGTCDYRAHLVFDVSDGTYGVVETTEGAAACTLAGVMRTVTIKLSVPVDADLVTIEQRYVPR